MIRKPQQIRGKATRARATHPQMGGLTSPKPDLSAMLDNTAAEIERDTEQIKQQIENPILPAADFKNTDGTSNIELNSAFDKRFSSETQSAILNATRSVSERINKK